MGLCEPRKYHRAQTWGLNLTFPTMKHWWAEIYMDVKGATVGFLFANSLITISKMVQYDSLQVKNVLSICKFKICIQNWWIVSSYHEQRGKHVF